MKMKPILFPEQEPVRFDLAPEVDMDEAESTLHLAICATEGLFGEKMVAKHVRYERMLDTHAILIDMTSLTGMTVALIYRGLLIREFGKHAFSTTKHDAMEEIAESN